MGYMMTRASFKAFNGVVLIYVDTSGKEASVSVWDPGVTNLVPWIHRVPENHPMEDDEAHAEAERMLALLNEPDE